ncbi:MAG: FAD-binding oxidoreductase [Alphaproteobacteria bacterium]
MNDPKNLHSFFKDMEALLGKEHVNVSEDTIRRYGENTMPGGDVRPGGLLFPSSTDEVQKIVQAANRHKVHVFPISTGNNQGLGMKSPPQPGQVIIDLGRRMNRILEINDTLCYAVVEPGVSYQRLHDELVRRGNKMQLDTTSGPPEGGILGNAMDKGAGYTPYFDHFGMSCGMEIVLGNGEILRTGDGGLPDSKTFHVSKYAYGPFLDGLFVQSNYGIVTKMGIWLMPKPPVTRSFHFVYDQIDDLAEIVDLVRPLKLSNFVPTLFRVANGLYLTGNEAVNPEFAASNGAKALSEAGRKALQHKHGLGEWVASGAFYGASVEAVAPMIERVKGMFLKSGKARYIDHDQALTLPPLRVAIDAFNGVPTAGELGLLKWRPGGGNIWFVPGTPMIGSTANELQKLGKQITEDHGLEYKVMNVCSGRFARGLQVITFNRANPEESARADRCYKTLAAEFAKRGHTVGRAPNQYYGLHMDLMMPVVRDTCNAIKHAVDPNGVLAPGKYGIG